MRSKKNPLEKRKGGHAFAGGMPKSYARCGCHVDLHQYSRTYIGKLEADGVIQRQGDGFPLDQSRVDYLRYLRRERQQSPRAAADAEHAAAKAALLRLRIEEKQRKLVRRTDVDALIDGIAGTVLTHLSSLPARCAPRGDLAICRSIERVVFEVRTEIAEQCTKIADERGEPPLEPQG